MNTIVCPWAFHADPAVSQHVVPRIARTLHQGTLWPLQAHPIPQTTNWFFNYQFWQPQGGKTVSWFTHEEPASRHPDKAVAWREAALRSQIRITMNSPASVLLAEHGPTFYIPPPVDEQFYRVKGGKRQAVGTAGTIYWDGRKGEDLIAYLHGRGEIEEVVGWGWNLPARRLNWADLPDWYVHLSVYVCASRLEGGPMGVIEALACGTKVVMAQGVGLASDIQHIPGVHLFSHEGNAIANLRQAIQRAQEDTSPASLRRAAVYGAFDGPHEPAGGST